MCIPVEQSERGLVRRPDKQQLVMDHFHIVFLQLDRQLVQGLVEVSLGSKSSKHSHCKSGVLAVACKGCGQRVDTKNTSDDAGLVSDHCGLQASR